MYVLYNWVCSALQRCPVWLCAVRRHTEAPPQGRRCRVARASLDSHKLRPSTHPYLYTSFTTSQKYINTTRFRAFPQSYLPTCSRNNNIPTIPSSSSHPMSPCATESSINNALVPYLSARRTSLTSLPRSSGNHVPRPRPFPNSYWATPLLVACEYPWTPMRTGRSQKIDLLLRAGVRTFIDLTESGELCPYAPHLAAHITHLGIDEELEPVEYHSFPIPDRCLPRSEEYVRQILDVLKDNARRGRITAVHCRGGIGRTGVVVGCWLVESGAVEDGAAALTFIAEEWKSVEKYRRFPQSPETGGQCEFVRNFERLQRSGWSNKDM
jgi:atypical dual specificity phosphatase